MFVFNLFENKEQKPKAVLPVVKEDAWHNGQNSWSSEHDQWAKESVEEDRLSVGDPVVVTAPNEYEGKTGEISEFSPSGKFVIVNLYNHGEHSMHLSDVEYNKYADDEVDEGAESSPVAGAITRRILMQRLDLLKQYGPELVGAAVDNVADYVGDVEEIGSSDVSGWVAQVERMLEENPPEAFSEGWFSSSPEEKAIKAEKQKQSLTKTLDSVLNERLPELVDDINHNQFEGSGVKWMAIRSGVFASLPILNDSIKIELKKVSDRITAKLKNTNPALTAATNDLFSLSLNPFKDSTRSERLKFNQQMIMDKEFLLKQLNQYLLLLNKGIEQGVAEGWSDAMVSQRTGQPRTPYSVYIKGKKWKDFENDDHAEAVANKLRAKFKADGRDPGVITIAPTDMSEGVAEAEGRVDPILIKALNRMPDGLASHGEVLNACYDAYAMELGRMEMKSNYGTTHAYVPQLMDLYKQKHGLTFKEAANPAQQAAIAVAMKKAGKKPKNESDDGDWVDDPTAHAQVNRSGFNKLTPQSYADKIDFVDRQLADPRQQQNWPEFKQRRLDLMTAAQRAGIVKEQNRVTEIKKGQKDSNGVTKCWPGYEASGTKKGKNGPVRNCVKKEGVAEAKTDYQKRREDEKAADAGKPVARRPKNPQTDYAKKRAKEKRDLEQFGESTNYWTRLQNKRNTKVASLVSELTESIEKK